MICNLYSWCNAGKVLLNQFLTRNFIIHDQEGKPRTRWEGVFWRDTSQILRIRGLGEEQKTEKNGGVFWGRTGPSRGCSPIDGMELINQSIIRSYRNINIILHTNRNRFSIIFVTLNKFQITGSHILFLLTSFSTVNVCSFENRVRFQIHTE